jgi:hypothetical protein
MKLIRVFCGMALTVTALAQSGVGSFQYVKQTDVLNDQERSYIWTLESRDPKRAAQLQLRCQQNRQTQNTDLFVALQHNLKLPESYGYDADVRWQYRFDKNTASSNWLAYFSEDKTRLYLADEARADFVAQAKRAQRLVVVATADNLAPQTFQFNLERFTEALSKLKCKVQEN